MRFQPGTRASTPEAPGALPRDEFQPELGERDVSLGTGVPDLWSILQPTAAESCTELSKGVPSGKLT